MKILGGWHKNGKIVKDDEVEVEKNNLEGKYICENIFYWYQSDL